jgi:hypothetical protein
MEILDKRVIYVHVCLYSCLYHTRPVLIRFTQLTPHTDDVTITSQHLTKVLIPQAYVTLADFATIFRHFGFYALKDLNYLTFK